MARLFSLVLLFCLALSAPAQEVTGSLTGSVTDPSGAAVSGATVTLLSERTAAVRSTTTDSEGNFVFTAVTPDFYTVAAEHPGFKKFQKQGLELTPGDKIAVGSIRLEMGAVSESITVRAEGAAVKTDTTEHSGSVNSEEISDLTVINRDFSQFAELQPGIVANVSQEVQTFSGNTTFNALGGRTTSNSISIDGITNANTNMSNMNTTLSLDTTASVVVKLGATPAEYGRNQGVTIMAISKGGTQQFHGALYYYFRNEDLNANTYFNNQKGTPRAEYRVSYAGGTFGGPLQLPHLRNKLFFLVSEEEIREVRPKAAQTVTVPTALERQGDFSQSFTTKGALIAIKDPTTGASFPGNVIPQSRILTSMQKYLNLLPLPNYGNTAVSGQNYNYVFQESLNVPKRDPSGRLDYNLSEKTQMYVRYQYWWEDQQGAAVSAGNASWGWLPDHYTPQTQTANLSVTHIFTPTTVLQTSLGYQRFAENGPPLSDAQLKTRTRTATGIDIPQFFPANNPYDLLPGATFGSSIPNVANTSYNARFPLRGVENTYVVNSSLSKVVGNHTFKTGLYGEQWAAMKGYNGSNFAGTLNFSQDSKNTLDSGYGYSNALLGVLDQYDEPSSRPPLYEYVTGFEWYVQDTWKLSRKVTLDVGARFGWAQPWHSRQGQEAGWVPSAWNKANAVQLMQPTLVGGTRMALDPVSGKTYPALDIGAIAPEFAGNYNGIVYRAANTSYPQGLRQTDGLKTAPRLGIAWALNEKTVIRAGGGVFYQMHDADLYPIGTEYTQPIQYNSQINYVYLQNLMNARGFTFPGTIQGFDVANKTPRTYNLTFGIERSVGFGTVVTVGYTGNFARHLEARINVNSTALGTDYLPSSLDATNKNAVLSSQFLRPYTGYGDINYYYNGSNSSYHSMWARMERRYKKGLTYGLVWTWSKSMDYADANATTLSNQLSQKIWNYGESGYDHTHILRAYWNYNLPKGSAIWNNKFTRGAFDNWQISGIYTAQSGAPQGVSVTFSPTQDLTGSTDGSGRSVLVVANPVLPRDQRGFYQAFNTASIVPVPYAACETVNPPAICWGNSPKYLYRGPGLNNWDMSIFKNFPISERLRGQFRVETYNTFNHTQFNTVDNAAKFDATGAQTNLTFGQYSGAANPRHLQLALRVMF